MLALDLGDAGLIALPPNNLAEELDLRNLLGFIEKGIWQQLVFQR